MEAHFFSGSSGKWRWIVVQGMIRELPAIALQYHLGQRLCITAFDSGPISPSSDEAVIGWTLIDDIMVSPPLTDEIDIPCAERDEWYLFTSMPTAIDVDQRYVAYVGFSVTPIELLLTTEPAFDRKKLEWLRPLQLQFWRNIERLQPISYISSGEYDIVVTSNQDFADRVLLAAKNMLGSETSI